MTSPSSENVLPEFDEKQPLKQEKKAGKDTKAAQCFPVPPEKLF